MSDLFEIVLAAVLVIAAGTPIVIAFSKARKEMYYSESEDE